MREGYVQQRYLWCKVDHLKIDLAAVVGHSKLIALVYRCHRTTEIIEYFFFSNLLIKHEWPKLNYEAILQLLNLNSRTLHLTIHRIFDETEQTTTLKHDYSVQVYRFLWSVYC